MASQSTENRSRTAGNTRAALLSTATRLIAERGLDGVSLALQLYPDASNGYNLHLQVRNYQLEPPELAGDAPRGLAEGHAHLMINGSKRIRIYSPFLHLDKSLFRPGMNQLTVTLNSHQHETWVSGKQPILATLFVDTTADEAVRHRFSAFPLEPE